MPRSKKPPPSQIAEKLDLLAQQAGGEAARRVRKLAGISLVAQCRQYISALLPVLLDIAVNGEDRDRLRAIEILLDRGYGKAPQIVNIVQSVDSETLQQIASAIIQKRELAPASTPQIVEGRLAKSRRSPPRKRGKK
jgi:hypothetical protein